MPRIPLGSFVLSLGAVIGCMLRAETVRAADPIKPEEAAFFEQKIRPLLVTHCYECHSEKAVTTKKLKAGLKVDSRDGLRVGGDSGPAVVPGNLKQSLLISAIRHEDWQMPPKGKLSQSVIADFEKWIEIGAPDPRESKSESDAPQAKSASQTKTPHWAFQPLQRVAIPSLPNDEWSRNAIDRFIISKQREQQLTPSPEADRVTQIRRVTFDLVGLPPSLDDVDEFLSDPSPDAYERVVDRLLASPHFGERWGRHWLDLARYADSSGFHNDLDRPTAWRYRDWVIRSLNDDLPYSRFVAEQLAGDEVEGANEDSIVATGFCRNGPSNDDNMGNDIEKYRLDQLDDVISTTASVYLGLTLGCARCHDHKYDPLPTEDYYRFLAIFNSTVKHGGVEHIKESKKTTNAKTTPLALVETSSKARKTFVLRRGNNKTPGAEVEPGVPSMLAFRDIAFSAPVADAKSTGRRRALAEWITSADNALAYRVLANRLWQHCFGRGIVDSTSNFGLSGSQPTHPELLDYLAGELIAQGGHVKTMLRSIVTSATYRQSSRDRETHDVENRYLSRQNIRRLEAEVLRDSVLTASGNLNPQMYGPGIKPRMRAELITASQRNKWPEIKTESPTHWRRSAYIYVKRQLLFPMMELFDSPTTTDSCSVRPASVVPTQALILMNDEFIEDQAAYLARHAGSQTNEMLLKVIERASRLTLSRQPSASRLNRSLGFVEQRLADYQQDGHSSEAARHKAMTDLCHVLLNSSEFVFVD